MGRRKYQLSPPVRLVRCLMALRGTPTHILVLWFDQDATTTRRDVIFCCEALIKGLEKRWIKWFDPHSIHYQNNKGINRFRAFHNVICAADCTLVCIIKHKKT